MLKFLLPLVASAITAGGWVENIVAAVPASSGVTLTAATIHVDHLETKAPGAQNYVSTPVNQTFNVLGGQAPMYPIGTWAQSKVVMGNTVHLEGNLTGGGSFEVDINIGHIPFDPAAPITINPQGNGTAVLRFANANFISSQEVWAPSGQHRVITTNDVAYAHIRDRLVNNSAFYEQ